MRKTEEIEMKRMCIGMMLLALSALVISCRGAYAQSIDTTISEDEVALAEATTGSLSTPAVTGGSHMGSLIFEVILFSSMGLGATILLARRRTNDSSSRTAMF